MKKIIGILIIMLAIFTCNLHSNADSDLVKNSKSAVLMESLTGEVVFSKDEHARRSPASMTKIMSLKIIFDSYSQGAFKMDDIMKEINAIFSITASHRNIDFRFNIDIKYNEHYGDYVAIKKIINNIISNAIKYTPDKGKVRVNLLSIGLDEDNKDVIMFVCEDTGVGMSPDFLRKMFRPFEREKDTKIIIYIQTSFIMNNYHTVTYSLYIIYCFFHSIIDTVIKG